MFWNKKKKIETFTRTVFCNNCTAFQEIVFPKGTRVNNKLVECPECGCKSEITTGQSIGGDYLNYINKPVKQYPMR